MIPDYTTYSINGIPLFTYGMIIITIIILAFATLFDTTMLAKNVATATTETTSQITGGKKKNKK